MHAPALRGYFQADDFVWLARSNVQDVLGSFHGSWGLGTAYRPLARLSYLLDFRLYGWNASGWHATNLLIHALNGALLASISCQLGLRQTEALAAAALFLVLPIGWESVDWISGRTGLLALFFSLLALRQMLIALKCRSRPYAQIAAFQIAALLCYEPAVMAPFAAIAMALPKAIRNGPSSRRLLELAGLSAIVVGAFWAFRTLALGHAGVATDPMDMHVFGRIGLNILAFTAHTWRAFTPPGWIFVVITLTCGLVCMSTRLPVFCLCAASVILYIPFILIQGFTERFIYLSSMPMALALTLSLKGELPILPPAWRRCAVAAIIIFFGALSYGDAVQMARSGGRVRDIMMDVERIPEQAGNLVFDGVPTHDGKSYLLWGAFEDALTLHSGSLRVRARSETVIGDPVLLDRVLRTKSSFFRYDAATRAFIEMPRVDWLRAHRVAGR